MSELETVFELIGSDGNRYTIEFHPDRINLRDEDGVQESIRVSPKIQMVLLVNFNRLVELLAGVGGGKSDEAWRDLGDEKTVKREIEKLIEEQRFWTPPDDG